MKDEDFIRAIRAISVHRNLAELWSDWIMMLAISISQACDPMDEREELFGNLQAKYTKEEREKIAELSGIYFCVVDEDPFRDLLGNLYMMLEIGNRETGQFFTPYHLGQLLADLTDMRAVREQIGARGYSCVNDPACGGGCLLISAAERMYRAGINYQESAIFVGQELGSTTACSAYIQLSMLGCPGAIICGDTLREPFSDDPLFIRKRSNVWRTPMYFGDIWRERRLDRKAMEVIRIGRKG